jgi:hypothetical protein
MTPMQPERIDNQDQDQNYQHKDKDKDKNKDKDKYMDAILAILAILEDKHLF